MMFLAGIRSESAARTVKRVGRATLSATPLIAAILVGGAAQAQQAAAPPVTDEVVVSGSRIHVDGFESPTPTAVVNEEVLKATATSNLADTLNTMPNFSGSATPQSSAITVTSGTQAVNALNLGGLGTIRTLVLVNGQRTVPSTLTGLVDVSELPQQLIKRVDVVTGGASASYGSDALSGIVNFVLDTHFTGIKGEVSAGETSYGDDKNEKISVTAGSGFANGRGHFEVSGESSYDPGVLVAHRPWNNDGAGIITNPNYKAGNGQPQNIITNHIGLDTYSFGGTIKDGPFRGTQFGPGGAISNIVPGTIYGGTADPLMSGGSWASNTVTNVAGSAIAPEVRRGDVFGRADYELTDNISVYAQAMYSQLYSFSSSVPVFSPTTTLTMSSSNPFLPAALAQQMKSTGVSNFGFATLLGDLGGPGTLNVQHPTTGRQNARYAFGFLGDFDIFGKNYTWDADTTYGWATQNVTNPGTIFQPNVNAAIQAITPPAGYTGTIFHTATGAPVVCSNVAPVFGKSSANTPGCVPFNAFGLGVQGANLAAVQNYLYNGGPWQDARNHQFVTSANIKGSPFDDWAGPVNFATGIEHREEGAHVVADPYESLGSNWALGIGPNWTGAYQVTEGYFEVDVPLLKDLPFAQSANLNAAIREAGYSAFGVTRTWKVGGTYSPGFGLTMRAMRSLDIREPTLTDLYSAGTTTSNSVLDPYNNNRTTIYTQQSPGNPNLVPESANNLVLGAVYQPTFIPRFSASVDYYNVQISEGISGGLSATQILQICFNDPTSPVCNQFSRSGTGASQTLNFTTPGLNNGSEHQNRMEFAGNYRLPLDTFNVGWLKGDMGFNVALTHYINYTTNSGLPGATPLYQVGASLPKWKYQTTVSYDLDPVSASITARGVSNTVLNNNYIACASGCPISTPNNPTYSSIGIDAVTYLDASVSYHFNAYDSKDELYFNVRNLLNSNPPLVPQAGNTGWDFFPASSSGGDILGRVMRVGLRFQM